MFHAPTLAAERARGQPEATALAPGPLQAGLCQTAQGQGCRRGRGTWTLSARPSQSLTLGGPARSCVNWFWRAWLRHRVCRRRATRQSRPSSRPGPAAPLQGFIFQMPPVNLARAFDLAGPDRGPFFCKHALRMTGQGVQGLHDQQPLKFLPGRRQACFSGSQSHSVRRALI